MIQDFGFSMHLLLSPSWNTALLPLTLQVACFPQAFISSRSTSLTVAPDFFLLRICYEIFQEDIKEKKLIGHTHLCLHHPWHWCKAALPHSKPHPFLTQHSKQPLLHCASKKPRDLNPCTAHPVAPGTLPCVCFPCLPPTHHCLFLCDDPTFQPRVGAA